MQAEAGIILHVAGLFTRLPSLSEGGFGRVELADSERETVDAQMGGTEYGLKCRCSGFLLCLGAGFRRGTCISRLAALRKLLVALVARDPLHLGKALEPAIIAFPAHPYVPSESSIIRRSTSSTDIASVSG